MSVLTRYHDLRLCISDNFVVEQLSNHICRFSRARIFSCQYCALISLTMTYFLKSKMKHLMRSKASVIDQITHIMKVEREVLTVIVI